MSTVIWTYQIDDTRFRIVQVNPADCVVEFTKHPDARPHGDPHWEAVDDDALAAQIYMTAYLQLRGTLTQVQALVNR
jgi:hypothetical protein